MFGGYKRGALRGSSDVLAKIRGGLNMGITHLRPIPCLHSPASKTFCLFVFKFMKMCRKLKQRYTGGKKMMGRKGEWSKKLEEGARNWRREKWLH